MQLQQQKAQLQWEITTATTAATEDCTTETTAEITTATAATTAAEEKKKEAAKAAVGVTTPHGPDGPAPPPPLGKVGESLKAPAFNGWARTVVERGWQPRWVSAERPHTQHRSNKRMTANEERMMEEQIQEYIVSGALELLPANAKPGNVMGIFPVGKKDRRDKIRLMTNFIPYNNHLQQPPHFKMQRPERVGQEYLQKGHWMAKIDLTDAYNHIRFSSDGKRYANVEWKGKRYRWNTLGFRLKEAPWVFTRMMQATLAELKKIMTLVDYLDDILVISGSKEQCKKDVAKLIARLEECGWTINWKKSEVEPRQEIIFLGFLWNTTEMAMGVPEEKIQLTKEKLKKLLRRNQWHLVDVQSIHGTVQAMSPGIYQSRMMTRAMQTWITNQGEKQNKKLKRDSTPAVRTELRWWLQELVKPMKVMIGMPKKVNLEVAADASDTGWGLEHEHESDDARLLESERNEEENRVERDKRVGVRIGSMARNKIPTTGVVKVITDSTVALAYLTKMKGGRKQKLTNGSVIKVKNTKKTTCT